MYNEDGTYAGAFTVEKLDQYDVDQTLATMKIYIVQLAVIHGQYESLLPGESRRISRMNTHNVITGLNNFVDQWQFADGLHMRGISQYNFWKSHMAHKLHGILLDLLVKALSRCNGSANHVLDLVKVQIKQANEVMVQITHPRTVQLDGVLYRADDFLFQAMELYLSGEDIAYIGSFLVAVAFFIQYNPSAGTFLNVATRLENQP